MSQPNWDKVGLQHGSVIGSTVALLVEVPGFNSQLGQGFSVPILSLCLHAPVSPSIKNMYLRLILREVSLTKALDSSWSWSLGATCWLPTAPQGWLNKFHYISHYFCFKLRKKGGTFSTLFLSSNIASLMKARWRWSTMCWSRVVWRVLIVMGLHWSSNWPAPRCVCSLKFRNCLTLLRE